MEPQIGDQEKRPDRTNGNAQVAADSEDGHACCFFLTCKKIGCFKSLGVEERNPKSSDDN